jgi:DNA-binding transcriptional ArsR family regulator
MLSRAASPSTLNQEVQRYLQDTLGLAAEIRRWDGVGKLPYYLQDTFEFHELVLLNQKMLLAVDRQTTAAPAAALREQLNAVAAVGRLPVTYVTATLKSYERKRLIQQKVPFIVPGNQLYLPGLGIDLREYFRQRPQAREALLSPSTQAMLIAALFRDPWEPGWRPGVSATKLNYTPMTVSRAVKELTVAGIAELRREGRERWLYVGDRPAEVWERAKPFLRSPVKRTAWANPTSALLPTRVPLAGLSALAQCTMLAEPRWPIRAISSQQWRSATRAGLEILPEPIPGAYEWQVWTYDPDLAMSRKTVDALSLTLSLQGESDERVQLALDELKEQFPW